MVSMSDIDDVVPGSACLTCFSCFPTIMLLVRYRRSPERHRAFASQADARRC